MADAAPVEGEQMEKDLARPAPDQTDRKVTDSMLVSLSNPDQWVTIGRNSEMSFASVDRSLQRQELKTYMGERAVILPESHEFTQMARRVSERLGIPEDTEFLAMDTEDFNAFFHPESRTVGFTRGFFRYFIERGLDVSEDHVAALLGHELEHAHVAGDDWLDKVKLSYLERALNMQNHAEEYRADAEAMSRLSRADYNPRAVVELLRAMPLIHGRNDLGHPEQIDRVRKLEDRLADDEHPLSNTSKPLTPLSQDLLTWFVQDSDVYNRTERLLHSSSAQLDQALASAETQPQFWEIFQIKRHVDKVEAAKALVDQEDPQIEQLAIKLMVLDAFTGKAELFVGREVVSIDSGVNNSIGSEEGGVSSEEHTKIFSTGNPFSEDYKVTSLLVAQGFRNTIPAGLEPGFSLESSKANLEEVFKLVDKVIQARFYLLESMDLSDDERRYFAQLRSCYEDGNAYEGLFLTLYSSLDLKLQTEKQEEAIRASDERGRRRPDSTDVALIDLQNPQERQRVLDQIKFAIAHHFIEVPEASEKIINKLSSTISHDTRLKEQEAAIIASAMLREESAAAWVDYLKQQDKESLKEIMGKVQDVHEKFKRPLFSPIRKFHNSYEKSSRPDDEDFSWSSFASGIEFGIDASGLEVIKMLAARELYLRGYPPDYNLDFNTHLPPTQINLTREEWNLIVKGHATHGIDYERSEWALMKYIEQIQRGETPDPEVVEYARKYGGVSHKTSLTAEQIQIMIKHSLWENERLQQMVVEVLDNWFDTRKVTDGKLADLSEQDRKEILTTLREAYVLFRNNPVDESKLGWGKKPNADKVASGLLDVLIQDITSRGIFLKDASMQALRQISTEGIFLNYLSMGHKSL